MTWKWENSTALIKRCLLEERVGQDILCTLLLTYCRINTKIVPGDSNSLSTVLTYPKIDFFIFICPEVFLRCRSSSILFQFTSPKIHFDVRCEIIWAACRSWRWVHLNQPISWLNTRFLDWFVWTILRFKTNLLVESQPFVSYVFH